MQVQYIIGILAIISVTRGLLATPDVHDYYDTRDESMKRALEKSLKLLEIRDDFLEIWKPHASIFEECLRNATLTKGWSQSSPPVQWRRLQFLKWTLPESLQAVSGLQLQKDVNYALFWITGKLQQQYRRMTELNTILNPCIEGKWNASMGDPVWNSYLNKRMKEL